MMKGLFFILFLIPLMNNWWLLMNILFLSCFFLIFYSSFTFYSLISYGYGMDCVSYWLVFLSFWICCLMILASYKVKTMNNYKNEFLFVIVILLGFLYLSFTTSNLVMFYIYFESSMIPTLFLIFGWGYQPERLLAGFYLLFYTLFASMPLLLGLFYINFFSNSLFYFLVSLDYGFYFYLSMILAFLVSMPMFFFHFWLPSAHVEAPVSGSMILAGVLLKLGGYGLYRVYLFLGMNSVSFNYFFLVFSMFGSFVVGFLCLYQVDIKSMIAYSSVAHMGLVIAGIMTMNCYGFIGSFVLMIGHGLCSSGLFALANIVYEYSGSRSLLVNSGLISVMPLLSMFWFLFSINNMASPPSLNLLGEILLFNSLVSWSTYLMFYLGISSFLSCCYSIYLFSSTQHGSLYSGFNFKWVLSVREYILLIFHWFPLNFLFLSGDMFLFSV
uniref:NADH-ubiquinone oxidoreductase chain 4 n=1 Tax=Neolethaeus assamensis TaxID=1589711 RepID=A0A343ISH3_9HEMI|nr:NADH dehydrogenase subunit 4 [Neolethaeus assamensis]AST10198.1 NADH dehydrogenase subunit 4 [Neolethaeus assamensis]